MEEPAIETDPGVLVRQIEKDVLPAGRMRRGVSKINRHVLRDRSPVRDSRTGGEIYDRRHR